MRDMLRLSNAAGWFGRNCLCIDCARHDHLLVINRIILAGGAESSPHSARAVRELHGAAEQFFETENRNAREGGHRETAAFLGDLQPVDALQNPLDLIGRLGRQRALLDQAVHDALDQSDLGVLEALKLPPTELEAEDVAAFREGGLDHFQDAGLPRAPVAMDADRDCGIDCFLDQSNDGSRDRLVVEKIDLGLMVAQITERRDFPEQPWRMR